MTGPQIPIGTFVTGLAGEPLGHIAAVYADNATGRLAWAAVQGRRHSAVIPLQLSRYDGETLHIPFDSEQLQTAPVHDPAMLISYAEGDELARHYGLLTAAPALTQQPGPDSAAVTAPGPTGQTAPAGPRGAQGSGAEESGGVSMVRSEEQLRVGAVNVVVGRARLETYIVTEHQTFTLPVRRQEVRLVYDVMPEDQQAVTETGPAEDRHEVVLHAEQIVFSTQIVPVERVAMVRRVVTTGQAVTAQLASEQIDTDPIDTGQSSAGQIDGPPDPGGPGHGHTSHAQATSRHHDHRET